MARGKIRKFDQRDRRTIGRVLRCIRKYRGRVLLSLLLAVVTVLLTLSLPVLTGQAIDRIAGPGEVDFPGLGRILFRMACLILAMALSQWLMNHLNNIVTYRVSEDIRNQAFSHIQELPVGYLDAGTAGDTVSRIITDVEQFSQGLLMGFTQLFTGVLSILATLVILFLMEPGITLLIVLLTPLSFAAASFITKKTYRYFSGLSELRGELTGYTEEMLGNLKTVKIFSREKKTAESFAGINARLTECSMKATFYSSIINPATRFVNALVYAASGGMGAVLAVKGLMTVGQLTAILSYANQYTRPFNEISGVVAELQNALASAARVFELIDAPAMEPDHADAVTLQEAGGEVVLDHIWFSYDKRKKLIQDLSVEVSPGQTVAIVGPTGCGKSTLINLLMRFYEVDEGAIRIDGYDNRNITRKSLRENFGMVLQETWLKSASIRENIAYGKPDAGMEEIIAAAKRAHCDGFIRKLPEGYETVLGEDGGALSQGQKQLLCIARLLLRLPPMLILDEATSSIDTRTELHIQHAFDRMMEGRTAFIVAHRLSTIRNADLILVMRDGNIVEKGRHEELLGQDGFYASLYWSQFDRSMD